MISRNKEYTIYLIIIGNRLNYIPRRAEQIKECSIGSPVIIMVYALRSTLYFDRTFTKFRSMIYLLGQGVLFNLMPSAIFLFSCLFVPQCGQMHLSIFINFEDSTEDDIFGETFIILCYKIQNK